MSKETIYREDAIKAVRSIVSQYVPFMNGAIRTLPIGCDIALRSIPSADRPQGEVDAVEIYEQAERRLERSEISIGEFESIVDPLRHLYYDRLQGWIPCSERLPKAEEKVWIQTKQGKVCFAMYEDGTISEDDSAWHWYDLPFEKWDEENECGIIPEGWWEWTEFHPDDEFDCPVDEEVVAWMPLPKPFEGADDEVLRQL